MKKKKIEKVEENNNFYITTPIYYASGKPHLGHAYTSIACDVLARWKRGLGFDVYFQTGTDEHGLKIVNKAEQNNLEPQEFVDSLIPDFKNLLKKLNISYDYFIRTTNQEHKYFVQDMLQKSYLNGDIYKAKYKGLYCVDCEKYYKEDELLKGNICPDHKREVSQIEEENYFFKLSKYEDKLLKYYEENPDFLSPKSKAQEIINRVKGGLEDISISRNKKSLDWGVEFPFDDTHVSYVWFDALFNYVSGLKINEKEDFWPADVHVVGKDIMWFHEVYWPAFLMSIGKEFPKKVFAHGWWTVDSEKMGKSMGNTIDPIDIVDKYGTDEFRYFVMSVGTFGDDLDFSYSLFSEKINNELNNDLGNLVSRVHAMTTKYFDGVVPAHENLGEYERDLMLSLNIFKKFDSLMDDLRFNHALDILWGAIRETNAYINKVEPWHEKDEKRLAVIINTLNFAVKMFSGYLNCFMPNVSDRIRKQFNFEKSFSFDKFIGVKGGHQIGDKDNLFSKVGSDNKCSAEKETGDNSVEKGIDKMNKDDKNKDVKKVKKIEAVLFDFDGVIAAGLDYHCENVEKFSNGKISCDEFISIFDGSIYDELKVDFDVAGYLNFIKDDYVKLEIDRTIKRELNNLAKNHKLLIVSSTSDKMLDELLKNNEMGDLFVDVLGVESGKSNVDKFNLIFDKYGLNKDSCVFVTDTLGDILEANEVGLKTIGVSFGFHDKDRLEKGNPFIVVNKFKKIRKAIKKLNKGSDTKSQESQQVVDKNNKDEKREIVFSDLCLKVGKVISVEQHPDAEKLYVEKIDVGEDEPRTIVSGLTSYYSVDEFVGKKVVVVCNLKPAKLRGIKSYGMVLVAEDDSDKDNKKIGLLVSDSEVGTCLQIADEVANCEIRIPIDDFFKLEFLSDGDKVSLNGDEVKAGKNELSIDRKVKGFVC